MVFFYIWQGYRLPHKNIEVEFRERKTVNKRFYDGAFVHPDSTLKSIRSKFNEINRRNKRTTNVTAIHSTIYEGDVVGKLNVMGNIIPLDLDGVDLVASIFLSDYIKKRYNLNGRTIILRTDKGHHLYIMNIVPFSTLVKILNDPFVSIYEDKDHSVISTNQGFSSMRITSTKWGKDNEIKVVFDEGEDVGEVEEEFARFLLRVIRI